MYNNINISTEDFNNTGSSNKPKPLQINIPKIDEIKSSNRMSLQVGTPRFHRRKGNLIF